MPITKDSLTLPDGFMLKPSSETYVRVGKVVSVSLFSRDLVVQYVDGEHDDVGKPLEVAVTATVIVGSDQPLTTFAPSASVYGRGDLVAVMIMDGSDSERYVISPMDDDEAPNQDGNLTNRAGYALLNEWALYDILNGLVVDVVDNGVNSFIEFFNFTTLITTRIEGNPDKTEGKRVMRRMLDYFGTIGQPDGSFCQTTAAVYPVEGLGGGPNANPQERLHGEYWQLDETTFEPFDVAVAGGFISGFKQVVDIPYGAADLTASLAAHHPTLPYLGKALCHPLASPTIETFYNPTVFRFGDLDSDYVLIAAVYPAWDTCSYINFIEIPVYALAERKLIQLSGVVGEEEDITHAWQLYADDVRVIHTINRNYIEWNDLDDNFDWSERASRALPIISSRYNDVNDNHTFGILDSRSWVSGGVPLDAAKINKIVGSVKRIPWAGAEDFAPNGSPWDYEIVHNVPTTGVGIVDNWYSVRCQYYDDNAGDQWEKHTCLTPTKEYPVITDGNKEFTKKVDFLFDIVGELTFGVPIPGYWGGEVSSTHEWWEHFYLNGTLLYTDSYERTLETDPIEIVTYDITYRTLLHIDLELGLVVAEERVLTYTGNFITGTCVETAKAVVFWNGIKYTIWEIAYTSTDFPNYLNFPYPWNAGGIKDGNYPDRPATAPHDYDANIDSVFFWPPYAASSGVDPFPFLPGTRGRSLSYPYLHGECTVQCTFGRVVNDYEQAGEGPTGVPYLQVSTDAATGAWVVRAPMWRHASHPGDTTLSYPNTHYELTRHPDLNNGNPFWGKPAESLYVTGDQAIVRVIKLNTEQPEIPPP